MREQARKKRVKGEKPATECPGAQRRRTEIVTESDSVERIVETRAYMMPNYARTLKRVQNSEARRQRSLSHPSSGEGERRRSGARGGELFRPKRATRRVGDSASKPASHAERLVSYLSRQ